MMARFLVAACAEGILGRDERLGVGYCRKLMIYNCFPSCGSLGAEPIKVENLLSRIQGHRKERIKDFEPLESSLLKSLCDGNQYSQFIDQLIADPQQLAGLSDKNDVIKLLTTLDNHSHR